MVWGAIRGAVDVLRHARSAREVLEALVPGLGPPIVLNEGPLPRDLAEPAALLAALREARDALRPHLGPDGVAYEALLDSGAFEELHRLAPGLRRVLPADLPSDPERIAFFLDLYNVLAIHGVLALEIHASVMEVPSFFARVSYRVGAEVMSLDAMEHGVLRRNARHPATLRRVFARGDPRHAYCPTRVDPRIHTALVCASTACPAIRFYDPSRLDEQLAQASAAYVNAEVRVTDQGVELPDPLRAYADDWGGRDGVAEFLQRYADEPLRGALAEAFATRAPWIYRRYDWSLNVG